MALEIKTVSAPVPPRNEYDDAFDYVLESETGWAAVVVDEAEVAKTQRGLSQAAKRGGRRFRYERSEPVKGKVEIRMTLRAIKPPKPADSDPDSVPDAA